MPDKKKSPAAKITDRRMNKPQGSKSTKAAEPARSAATRDGAVAAMKLFHARKLQEARDLFQSAAAGPERDVAQRAKLHISMCDRRLQQATVTLKTAEDYYNYGVALMNARNIGEARSHLEKALAMAPDTDHIHYALALAQALSGDSANAYENLRRAIELEPRNRIIARQDTDFAPLANQPPFDMLLFPEKKGW